MSFARQYRNIIGPARPAMILKIANGAF